MRRCAGEGMRRCAVEEDEEMCSGGGCGDVQGRGMRRCEAEGDEEMCRGGG